MTLAELLVAIVAHHKNNPTHGITCACMDGYIQDLRQMTNVGDADVQRRVDYVMFAALRERTISHWDDFSERVDGDPGSGAISQHRDE